MLVKKYLKILKNPKDTYQIFEALEFIKEAKPDEAIPILFKLLSHPDKGVQQAAVDTLIAFNTEKVFKETIKLLYESDAALRNMGIEILSEMDKKFYHLLLPLLDDPDDDIRKFAIDIISKSDLKDLAPKIIKVKNDKNANVRSALAEALGNLKNNCDECLKTLIEFLDDPEDWVKFSAIEALGKLDAVKVTPLLLDKMKNAPDYLQKMIIEALGNIGTPDAIDPLLEIADNPSSDEETVAYAVQSLVNIAKRYNLDVFTKLQQEKFEKVLLDQLKKVEENEDMEEYFALLDSIGTLKVKGALIPLIKKVAYLDPVSDYELKQKLEEVLINIADDDIILNNFEYFTEDEKKVAIEILGYIKSKKAVPLLLNYFKVLTQHNKRAIVKALGEIGDPSTYDFFINCLKDPDGHVRRIAAQIIGKLKIEKGFDELTKLFEKGDYEDVIEAVLNAMLSINKEKTKKVLVNLLSHPQKPVKLAAIKGLAEIGGKDIIELFIKEFNSPEAEIRKLIIEALNYLKYKDDIQIYIDALNDVDEEVQIAAMKAIGELGIKEAYPYLTKYFSDENEWIKYQALNTVADLHITECIDEIINMYYIGNRRDKEEILNILSKLGDCEQVKIFLQEITENEEDPELAQLARNILEYI